MTGTAASLLRPIEVGDLPVYPIERGERLESHSFFLFHFDRWLNSDLYLLGDWDVKGVATALWCLAQNQDPVGTLPENPRLIAALLRMSTDQWDGYTRREPSPLHGWYHCTVGDEVRLMHRVVTEVAVAALSQRLKGQDRREADRERNAIKRLRGRVELLAGSRFAAQEMFIVQLYRLLQERYPGGNNTDNRVIECMEEMGVRDLKV